MCSAAGANPTTSQQIICETSDKRQIAVELEVLRMSRTFDNTYKKLSVKKKGGEYPGTFPVKNIEARVFKKVVDWCKAHKGQPDPVIEKDSFTQECNRFKFTKYEQRFFKVPAPELLKLVMAASYPDIPGLYHYGCQAIADLIKGKETLEARLILQQEFDLTRGEIRTVRSHCPWLDRTALGKRGDVSKLTRADLDRLQLVSQQFHKIISHNEELPLRVLDEVHFTNLDNYSDYRQGRCAQRIRIADALCLKGCAVRKLEFHGQIKKAHVAALLAVKSAWKEAVVSISLNRFDKFLWYGINGPTSETWFTDFLFCKELRVRGHPALSGHIFMRSCNHLDMKEVTFTAKGYDNSLKPAQVIEWLEYKPKREWDEPRQLDVSAGQLSGGHLGVVDALKTAFLSATSCKPYVLRIRTSDDVQVNEEEVSNAFGEQLRIRFEDDGDSSEVVIERE